MKYKNLFIDLDDTLWDTDFGMEWERIFCKWKGDFAKGSMYPS